MLIKELRKITGLTQAEFAKKFHIPVGTLAHWEQEIRKPPEYVVYMMAKIVYMERIPMLENRGVEAMKEASKIASENGIANMSLDEINAEIDAVRK